METNLFHVDTLVNGVNFAKSLIDTGCSCYATINQKFAKKLRLSTIKIPPREISGYNDQTVGKITRVAHASLDIGGHLQEKVFMYVVKNQSEDLILGQAWIQDQHVRIDGDKSYLRIIPTGEKILTFNKQNGSRTFPCNMVTGSTYGAILKRAKKDPSIKIFAASMKDIEKALAGKPKVDPSVKLPAHYHQYLDVFSMKEAERLPPHRPEIDLRIKLEKDKNGREKEAPWGPLYNMSREELLVLRKTLIDLLDKNWIRVSRSSAAAPVLFAHKPGGGLRFCIDYRALNAITEKDRYPLPLIRETLQSLGRAKWLTKLDVTAAFHKVRVTEGDEEKTAFRTRYGLFEWLVCPFGLTGAPAMFQRFVNSVLRDYLDIFCTAYIDDILIYSNGSLNDHRKKVCKVLEQLREAGLQLDISKCEFEAKTVKYLGYVITAGQGIAMDQEKVKAIAEWAQPTTVKAVRSFLGFANYYRMFIKNYSALALPLTALTKKGKVFEWTKECEKAFQLLKQRFMEDPILASFQEDRETRVEPDASGWATGGVLSQLNEKGEWHPTRFFSKKHLSAECNYDIHDKELLAIVRCLEEWDAELRSLKKPFTIFTDHNNLKYFMTKHRLTERQMRWAEILSRYNFRLLYRPGKTATAPDALSRRPQDTPKHGEDRGEREKELLPAHLWIKRLFIPGSPLTHLKPVTTRGRARQGRTNDNSSVDRSVYQTWVLDGSSVTKNAEEMDGETPFPEDPELQELWKNAVDHDIIYKRARDAVKVELRKFPPELKLHVTISECRVRDDFLRFRDRLWVPNSEPLTTRLIQKTHDSALTGHPGREATLAMLCRRFYWPGQSQDVRKFLKACDVCNSTTIWREKKHGLLKPLPLPGQIWKDISMDFITDLPLSNNCSDLLVIRDRFSRGILLEATSCTTAEATAERFIHTVYRLHGLPRSVVTDRGRQWDCAFWKRLCALTGIQRRMSSAFHPETDGSTERANPEVEKYLRIFTNYAQSNWANLLPSAELAYNNKNATATGFSPFFLTHGYDVEPITVTDSLRTTNNSPIALAESMVNKLRNAREWAELAMAVSQQDQEMAANRHRQPAYKYRVGDKVWLDLRNVTTDRPNKKLDRLHGKYTITRVINSHTYELDTPGRKHNRFHAWLLRPAGEEPLPSQKLADWQPPPIQVEGEDEWEVEAIQRQRKVRIGRGTREEVLVKWKGYSEPTWEPRSLLQDTSALDAFEKEEGSNVTG